MTCHRRTPPTFTGLCLALTLLLAGCLPGNRAATIVPPTPTATPYPEFVQHGTLTWGADAYLGQPFVWSSTPDQPGDGDQGFEVDLATMLGSDLKLTPQRVQGARPALPTMLATRQIDAIINGVEVTSRMPVPISFTVPYYVDEQTIVVRQGAMGIASLKDLSGKRVGVGEGYAAEDLLVPDPRIKLQLYPTGLPFDDLAAGKLDAVVIDQPLAVYYAGQDKRLRIVNTQFDPVQYAIAVMPWNQDLLNKLNDSLTAMKQDGRLRLMLNRWNLWTPGQAAIGIQ